MGANFNRQEYLEVFKINVIPTSDLIVCNVVNGISNPSNFLVDEISVGVTPPCLEAGFLLACLSK